jgi:hypothetical protein
VQAVVAESAGRLVCPWRRTEPQSQLEFCREERLPRFPHGLAMRSMPVLRHSISLEFVLIDCAAQYWKRIFLEGKGESETQPQTTVFFKILLRGDGRCFPFSLERRMKHLRHWAQYSGESIEKQCILGEKQHVLELLP